MLQYVANTKLAPAQTTVVHQIAAELVMSESFRSEHTPSYHRGTMYTNPIFAYECRKTPEDVGSESHDQRLSNAADKSSKCQGGKVTAISQQQYISQKLYNITAASVEYPFR